ncbi:MAG: DNA mismatch repair endonuclease MutL [Clostridia bacterium]|nr:DNA mismatch repair endonuclease MutL [Clostridia bacterium]
MAINILDSMIINRISAGEVVESPFSIVKELIDNSLDAGATKITVEIKNGGIDQIIVRDNGKGIEKDDIVKAFLPHATSKIKDIADLEAIMTLGFRGEALASISNVSQTNMLTKTKDGEYAHSIEINGGVFGEVQLDVGEQGTKIEVNNLFFNTPARRKFLRKPKQEENQITNILARYILAHPGIAFRYIVDDKTIYQTNGGSLLDAIYCVYGDECVSNIMYIEKELGEIKVSGYVSSLGYSKPNTTHQTLMINSRYVIDEIVSKAVYMAFEEYLMPRQFPFYVLNITMPATDVDVNVHPSKLNVKFSNPSKIYDLVYGAVSTKIYQVLNPTIAIEKPTSKPIPVKENLINIDLSSLQEIEVDLNPTPAIDKNITIRQAESSPITIFDYAKESNIQTPTTQDNPEDHYQDIDKFSDYKIVGELFNEFIILEREDKMLLLDFHAGHERLNYDKFTRMVENRDIVIQDLLVPYSQSLSLQELDFLLSLKNELSTLGFDLDSFGDSKVIISAIPMQLKDINLKNFIDDLLHDMKNLKPSMNNEIRHYLMQKACKSSVKSGMRLSEMEIQELLKNLDINHPVLLCPHGRPIVTVVNRSQIEKWFKRIV